MVESRDYKYLTVYSDGRVWSNKANKWLEATNSGGYKTVKDWPYKVHRLVWLVFKGELPEGYDVHHKNGIKDDNRLENLELIKKGEHETIHNHEKWAKGTYSGNGAKMKRAWAAGAHEGHVEKLRKQVAQLSLDGRLIKIWPSTVECGRNGYSFGDIAACCRGEGWGSDKHTYKGFRWMWHEDYEAQKDKEANLEKLASLE